MADVNVSFAVTDEGNGYGKLQAINNELDKTQIAGQNSAVGTKAASLSLTDLWSAVNLAQQGLRYLEGAYDATAGKAMDYANTVRELSSVSGESAEDTSRFIQVLDDWQISAEDAMIATKALTKEGLAPNIDTLAMLSDEYLKLNTVEEKNEFILKNLGKGGLQWTRVLEQGSKALREQGKAVKDGLVLSQEQLDAAEENRLAIDALSDSWDALSITVGNKVIPVMNDATRATNATLEGLLDMGNALEKNKSFEDWAGWAADIVSSNFPQTVEDGATATNDLADASDAAAQALADEAASLEEIKERAKKAREELNAISDANNQLLDITLNIAQYNKDYAEKHEELWQAVQDGEEGALEKLRDLEAEYMQWQNQMIFDIILEKLKSGVEGLSTSETEYALNLAETLGIIDEASRNQAESFLSIADTLTSGFQLTEEEAALAEEAIMDVKAAADKLNGTTATVKINVEKTELVSSGKSGTGQKPHATGGSWVIPAEYGYEGYRMPGGHTASAGETVTVTPTTQVNKGGTTIIINNPTAEPSSDSLRGTLRTLSYLGVDV